MRLAKFLASALVMYAATSSLVRAGDFYHPTVVELYQSQGCSSCPPANANVNALANRPDILALSFAVTYWDQLGWKDRFATPAYTQRQWDYARGLGHSQVWTPQVIINGTTDNVGNQTASLNAAIAAARAPVGGPALALSEASVSVSGGAKPDVAADVWLVRFDPRTIEIAVKAGENNGRTLPHRNIVRELVRLGKWNGSAAKFSLPAAAPGLATAILVQAPAGGQILAAVRG